MKSGWLDSTGYELRVLCIRDLEEGSDDFRIPHEWADPSKILPKAGCIYRVAIAYGLKIHFGQDNRPVLALEFMGVVTNNALYQPDKLVVFDSIDKFSRYFILQGG